MRKYLASLLFILTLYTAYSQEVTKDSAQIIKSAEVSKERVFKENLKEKYSGKDFQYKEEKVKVNKNTSSSSGLLEFFVFFMSKIFPFLLGGFVLFLLLKVIFGLEFNFWQKSNANQKTAPLIYEDEDVNEINIVKLLQQALQNKDFRLAVRYYYLQVLKDLSNKKIIDYHKDKTNTEYLFEIDNKALRDQFSHLSYIYAYVWYGEFLLDENSFKKAQNKYQSFLKQWI